MTGTSRYTTHDLIPMSDWGRDHWTTLAYVETVIVEFGGFQMGTDARMRSNRRNYRVMAEGCPKPKRMGAHPGMAIPMDGDHGSVLADGTTVPGHDDWCCLQDAANAGLLASTPKRDGGEARTLGQDEMEPGVWISLSERGEELVNAIRRHKAGGGTFRDFVVPESFGRDPAVPAP